MLLGGFLIWAVSLAAVAASAWLVIAHYRGESQALRADMARRTEFEARYHAIFEHAPMGCMVWEPGFSIVEWNRQAEQIFGWTRAQMLGRSFIATLADDVRDAFMRDAIHLLAGSLSHGNLTHLTRDGETIVCQWHHAVLHDSDGAPTQVVSTCINVTVVTELQIENALFRRIIDLTDDPSIMLADAATGRLQYASASFGRHLGRQPSELMGTVPSDWDAHLSPDIMASYEKALQERNSVCFETEHRHASGRLIPVEVTLNLIEHDGKPYIAGYARNISVRKEEAARVKDLEVAAALREHEKRYREIFENSSDALFTVDVSNGTRLSFDTANPAAERAFGLPASLLKGMQFGKMADGEMGKDFGAAILAHLPKYLACALTGMPAEYDGPLDLLSGDAENAPIYHVQLFPLAADEGIERIICIGRDVTLRNRYEAELEAREQAFRALAENIPAPIYRFDRDFRRVYVSPIVAEITGTPIEDLLGSTPLDAKVVVPASVDSAMRSIRSVFETGDKTSVDLVYATADAQPREFRMALVPERDAAGNVVTVLAVAHDITEHKRYEAALLERARLQEQIGAVAQAVPGFLFSIRVEPDGRAHFPFASAGVEELFGLRPDEFRDDAELLRARYHPDDRVRILAAMDETKRTLGPLREEIRIRHPQREGWRWVAFRSTPQRQPDGATEWHGVVVDIDDAKKNELALAENLRFTRDLLDAIPDPVFYKDVEGRYLGFNVAFERFSGKTRDEMIGKGVFDLWPRDLAERYFAADRQLIENRGHQVYESQIETPDGRRDVIFHKAVFTRADGRIGGQIGIALDITERKCMERALRASEADSRASSTLLKAVLESSPDVVAFALGRDYRYLAFNNLHRSTMREIWGKEIEIGMSMLDVIGDHPDREKARQGFDRAFAGESFVTEEEYGDEERARPFWSTYWSPIRENEGAIVGITCFILNISERKRLELAVRKSEQLFRSLTEGSPDFIARFDSDGRVRYVNDVLVRHLALGDAANLIGRTISELWPDGRLARMEQAMESALQEGATTTLEHVEYRADGTLLHHHVRIVPEYGVNGEIVGTLGFGRDITERHKLEEELKRRAQYQRTLLDNFPFFVWLKDEESRLLAANLEYARLAKAPSPRDLEGKTDFDVFPRELARKYVADDRTVMASRVPKNVEEAYVNEHGEQRWMETWKAPVVVDDRVVGTVGFSRDITERIRAEVELRHAHDFTERLINAIPDPIIIKDKEHRWLLINDAACALFGHRRDQFLGKTDYDFLPAKEADVCWQSDDLAFFNGQENISEEIITDAAGRLRTVQPKKVIAKTNRGDVLIAVIRDVTALKETERHLEQSQRRLQQLSARREEEHEGERKRVARELHEEFGQMLSALRMEISTLPLQYGQQLPLLRQRSEIMLNLIDQTIQGMRDVVTSLRPTVLDAGITTGLEWLAHEFTRNTGVPCTLHAPDSEPAIEDDAATLVFRVMQEALSNVTRHAHATRVDVRLELMEASWCAEVRDDGRGFEAKPQARKSLGVFGMEQCAVMLGGTLEIESSPGRGTALRLRFPAQ
jgi:PAS domain S-box-containing protein